MTAAIWSAIVASVPLGEGRGRVVKLCRLEKEVRKREIGRTDSVIVHQTDEIGFAEELGRSGTALLELTRGARWGGRFH